MTVDPAVLKVADAVGALIEAWGFRRNMGRMWAVLYLEDHPLTAADLGERLGLSTGAVSMLVNELVHWGIIKKTWVVGERRDHYEPETSIWKMISRVFRERELGKVREAIDAFEAAIKLVAQARSKVSSDEKKRLKFIEGRLESLLTVSRLGEGLLGMLVSGSPIDPQPLKSLFERDDR